MLWRLMIPISLVLGSIFSVAPALGYSQTNTQSACADLSRICIKFTDGFNEDFVEVLVDDIQLEKGKLVSKNGEAMTLCVGGNPNGVQKLEIYINGSPFNITVGNGIKISVSQLSANKSHFTITPLR